MVVTDVVLYTCRSASAASATAAPRQAAPAGVWLHLSAATAATCAISSVCAFKLLCRIKVWASGLQDLFVFVESVLP